MLDLNPDLIKQLDTQARQAIELWGNEAQFNMVIEETSELLNEVAKIHRNRQNWDNILEEAVDTYIMMTEVFIMYGPEATNAMLEKKLNKFKGNLDRSAAKKAEKDKEIAEAAAEVVRRINNLPQYVGGNRVGANVFPIRPRDNVVSLFPEANTYSGA